jgi:SSS family solute:Na+ symporter
MARRIKDFGDRFRAHTIGDFFGMRYSAACRYISTALIIFVYLLLCAAQFVGMTSLLEVWTGSPFRLTIVFAAVSTIIYTAFAGIKSDFYTDGIHFVVMTGVLFFVLLPRSLRAAGGLSSLSRLPPRYWDPFAYGGVSFFIAGIAFGIAGVFVTMEIWQRIFAATSSSTARRALVVSGGMILMFYSLSTFLGLLARLLLPALDVRDHALFALMGRTLPSGFLGLGLAAFLAVFISTVNTMMMVTSASVTKDIYVSWLRPAASDRDILRVGRIVTFGVGIVSYLLAVWIHDLVVLAVNSLFVLLVLMPAIVGGFFWKRATATAAWMSMVIGFAVVVALTPRFPNEAFAPGFVVSAIVFVTISLITSHGGSERLEIVEG